MGNGEWGMGNGEWGMGSVEGILHSLTPHCPFPIPLFLVFDRFRGASPARRRRSWRRRGFGRRRRSSGRLKFADAQRGAEFGLDLVAHRRVFAERVLSVVAPLTQALALVREPRAGLVDDLVLDADVD